jgi:peptidoglycan/xylan/chitin deacetylase (PgdA/CDA1 family)
MRNSTKPFASLSLDLDDKWTYMKTHGNPNWTTYPSYLQTIVPRILTFLKERGLRITFFLVGQDAAFQEQQPILRSIADAGHEIANHSFHHEPWLHLYSKGELHQELALSEHWIEIATGQKPTGFRGPGFSVSDPVIETLISRGYRYDASTLPTFIGPFARLYYFFSATLDAAQKEERSRLFGSFRDGLRPLAVHYWHTSVGPLLEIPVTTMPIVRTPFHLSYLLYLSRYSPVLARFYLRAATLLCRFSGVQPSFLLHPLDFASPEDATELAFFPGMRLSLDHKLEVANNAIHILQKSFEILPVGMHVRHSEKHLQPKRCQR